MVAPTFIQEAETAWNTTTTPKTTAAFTTLANDVLVAFSGIGDNIVITRSDNTGGALTWAQPQTVAVSNFGWASEWTTTDGAGRSMTVTFARAATTAEFGGNVLTFRGSDGLGASAKTNVTSGAPSLSITTTQDNSAIVVFVVDWNATDGTSRTWRSVNGSPANEVTYFRDSTAYAVYGGYYADAGLAGAKTVGLSAPSGQKYSIVAVEVFGSAGGGSTQTVSPSGVASAEAEGTPTVVPGTVNVAPSGIASAEAFGTPALSLTVAPSGIASAEALGTPTLAPGPVMVSPGGVASAEAVGSPVIGTGAATIGPAGIASSEAFGTDIVTGGIVGAGNIASGEAFGTPAITVGPVTVDLTGQGIFDEAVGTPLVTGGVAPAAQQPEVIGRHRPALIQPDVPSTGSRH